MKPTLIVILPLLLLANPAMAEGVPFYGEQLKGHAAVAHDHQIIFRLFGDVAKTTYGYMKEEATGNAGTCKGDVKRFPGFLCVKGTDFFECIIRINLKEGVLEGESGEICEYAGSSPKRPHLAMREMFVGDGGMTFHLIGDTAKVIYNKMSIESKNNDSQSCLGGAVKRFNGLECSKYKNKYECYLNVDLAAKKMRFLSEMCPQE
ncbi:MAG: hypothetical protein LBI92_08085 [Azoarcus sp.]|jgi:hypothetical protein|nr:hypothetical protein [Azoarcus sp.]